MKCPQGHSDCVNAVCAPGRDCAASYYVVRLSETRSAEEIRCGIPSGAEVVYAESREAEEAADRRHDFSDHLEPWEISR